MMKDIEKDVMEILKKQKAFISNSHFVYASGRHGDKYINKDAIFISPLAARRIGESLAIQPYFKGVIIGNFTEDPEVIVGPVVGGAILAQWAAYCAFMMTREVLAVYADKEDVYEIWKIGADMIPKKEDTKFVIKRGYDKLIKDKCVLVVEDIMTTGSSVKKVVQAVRDCGGIVDIVSVIVNRGGVTAEDIGVKHLCSLIEVDFESYTPEDCPFCKEGIPINTEFGKGKEFVKGESENEI